MPKSSAKIKTMLGFWAEKRKPLKIKISDTKCTIFIFSWSGPMTGIFNDFKDIFIFKNRIGLMSWPEIKYFSFAPLSISCGHGTLLTPPPTSLQYSTFTQSVTIFPAKESKCHQQNAFNKPSDFGSSSSSVSDISEKSCGPASLKAIHSGRGMAFNTDSQINTATTEISTKTIILSFS